MLCVTELGTDVWCALLPACSFTTIVQLTATCQQFNTLVFQHPTILSTLINQVLRLTVSQQQLVASNRMSHTELVHRLLSPLAAVEHSVLHDHRAIPRLHLSLLVQALLHSAHSNHRLSQLHSLRHAALQSTWWHTYWAQPPRSLSLHSLALSDFSLWLADAFHPSHFPSSIHATHISSNSQLALAAVHSRFEMAASVLCGRALFIGAAWLDNRCFAVGYFFGGVEYTQQIGERVDRAGQRERFVQAYSDSTADACRQSMASAETDWERLPVIAWEVKGETAATTGEERIGYYFSLIDFLSSINSRAFLHWHDEQFVPSVSARSKLEAAEVARDEQEESGEVEEQRGAVAGGSRYLYARHRRVALKLEALT